MNNFKFKQLMANREQLVNEFIIELEKSDGNWTKSYYDSLVKPHNPYTKTKYTGINVTLLQYHMMIRGLKDPRFMTFHQIKESGYKLRSNSKGILLERWIGANVSDLKDIEGLKETVIQEKTSRVVLASSFYVFSVEDIVDYKKPFENELTDIQRYQKVLDIANALNIRITESNTVQNPAYWIDEDVIKMPPQKAFKSNDHYFATLLHEIVHATGAKHRLCRFESVENNRERNYAKEEMIAEFTKLQLAKSLQFEFDDIQLVEQRSKSYLKSWIQSLDNDFNEFYRTAKESEKILEYIDNQLEMYYEKDFDKDHDFVKGIDIEYA